MNQLAIPLVLLKNVGYFLYSNIPTLKKLLIKVVDKEGKKYLDHNKFYKDNSEYYVVYDESILDYSKFHDDNPNYDSLINNVPDLPFVACHKSLLESDCMFEVHE